MHRQSIHFKPYNLSNSTYNKGISISFITSVHSVPIYQCFFSFSINFFLIEMTTYKKKNPAVLAHLHLNFTICLTTLNIS